MVCLLRDVQWIFVVDECGLRKSSTHLGLQCICIDSNSLQMVFQGRTTKIMASLEKKRILERASIV